MPLAWSEVKPGLDPAVFTLRSVPDLLGKRRRDPWAGFRDAAKPIPDHMPKPPVQGTAKANARSGARRPSSSPGNRNHADDTIGT